jgi:hypothetical protein
MLPSLKTNFSFHLAGQKEVHAENGGIQWTCCGQISNTQGCVAGEHEAHDSNPFSRKRGRW